MHPLVLILGSVVLNTAGQLAFKKASAAIAGGGSQILALPMQPALWVGLACYGCSTLLWLVVLSRSSLSYAYPMVAVGYVLVTIAAAYFFGEAVSLARWGAMCLIMSGVALLALT